MHSNTYSISKRFCYTLIGVVTLVLFFFSAIAIFINKNRMNNNLEYQLKNNLKLSEVSLIEPLWNFDFDTINGFIDALFLHDSVVYVGVVEGNRIIAKK